MNWNAARAWIHIDPSIRCWHPFDLLIRHQTTASRLFGAW